MSSYYNCCMLEPLGHALRIKMNINTLETIFFLLVYSYFLSFVTLFQHIKSLEYAEIF
jgi:hypothetical protein